MKFHPECRSAMNIRFDPEVIKRCKKLGFIVKGFNRKDEPREIKKKEGTSLSWGMERVLKGKREIPDIIYDEGDVGKEAMIRVIGRTPYEVAEKIIRIAGKK
jgi:hydroxymethylpyrimidine/phosphomethylpyrimidine kinase